MLDLFGIPHPWLLIGQGRAGETTFARWAAEQRLYGRPREVTLATVQPAQRTLLAGFFEGVEQPESSGEPTQAVNRVAAHSGHRQLSPPFRPMRASPPTPVIVITPSRVRLRSAGRAAWGVV